jgi:HSP20 family protein
MSFLEQFKKNAEIEIPSEEGTPKKRISKPNRKKIEVKSEKHKTEKSSRVLQDKVSKDKEKWFEPEGQLAVDIYQTNKELVIQSAIAGIRPEDLDISIEEDMVLIKGDREKPEEDKGKRNYFYKECYWGKFSREIILPVEVDASQAKAAMKQGILTLRIPKIEREKKKKIKVKEN